MYRLPKHAYHFLRSQRDPNVFLDGIESGRPIVHFPKRLSWPMRHLVRHLPTPAFDWLMSRLAPRDEPAT